MSARVRRDARCMRLNRATHSMDIGVRNECSAAYHLPVTYNPMLDVTFCRCGLVIRAGDAVPPATPEEDAAANARWAATHDRNGRRLIAAEEDTNG